MSERRNHLKSARLKETLKVDVVQWVTRLTDWHWKDNNILKKIPFLMQNYTKHTQNICTRVYRLMSRACQLLTREKNKIKSQLPTSQSGRLYLAQPHTSSHGAVSESAGTCTHSVQTLRTHILVMRILFSHRCLRHCEPSLIVSEMSQTDW